MAMLYLLNPILFLLHDDAWGTLNASGPEIIGQMDKPIREIMRLTAQSVTETHKGIFTYDMGQNMVGVPEIKICGKAGDLITIRYAEVLYPKLPEYGELDGLLLMENLRDAACTDLYICKGGEEIIRPRFTFHGYRYLEISGLDNPPSIQDVSGIVISSITGETSEFECSDDLANRFFQNVLWSQRANFISIPTDCPQRNERLGWMGDAQVFAKTALYNADVRTLYYRFMQAVRDVQAENGRFADIAPVGGGFGGIVWVSAGLIIPYEMHKHLGEMKILEENFTAMESYASYLTENYKDGRLVDGIGAIGDWLATETSKDSNLIFNAYYVYDMKIMAEMSATLGKNEKADYYAKLHEAARKDWLDRFIDSEGRTIDINGEPDDTQCSYAIALDFDIPSGDMKKKMAAHLNRKTKELNYTLTTGFVGTAPINLALTDNGYAETAFKLFGQREYPSWIYSVTQGATTIWERWNSYTVEKGFGGNNSMNSFNHYSLGAVCAWLFRDVLGIRCEDGSGYQSFILKPTITELDFASGSYNCPYGKIESAWKRESDLKRWEITIPPNSRAEIVLPTERVCVNGEEKSTANLVLSSGKYSLEWQEI